MNIASPQISQGCHAPLQDALDWWAALDDMGGFRTAGRALFPRWEALPDCCLAPHREERLPHFSIRTNPANIWYFKDRTTGQVGGLLSFVMLAGMDENQAARWLMERNSSNDEARMTNDERMTKPEGRMVHDSLHSGFGLLPPPPLGLSQDRVSDLVIRHSSFEDKSPPMNNAIIIAPDSRSACGPDAKPWSHSLGEAIVSSGELQTMELRPRPKLLGDWFCEGDLGFIYAFRGVGKTWLAMLMARALSEGGSLGEWKAPAPARVLYIDGEMPPDLMRQRDRGLARSTGGALEFLNHEILFRRTHRVMNITHTEVQQAILERCEATGVKVLILDNLSTLASGMKENDADDWEMVGRWLLGFRRRQIAVIVIHHAGRNGEMRGTTKREDDAGWIIALDDARQAADDRRGARFITRFSKQTRNTPEEVPPFEWHISPDNGTGIIKVHHRLATGIDLLRKLVEEGITECSELSEELGVSKGTVSKWAHKGILDGWLVKQGRCYTLKA